MPDVAARARAAAATIAGAARHVAIEHDAVPSYASSLGDPVPYPPPAVEPATDDPEERAAFHLQLDAINFGSGWFPTLRKRDGRSGFFTVALALRDRGAWSAEELRALTHHDVAAALGQ